MKKYRGKRVDNGEWVTGNLITMNNKSEYGNNGVFSNYWIMPIEDSLEVRAFVSGCEVWVMNGCIQVLPSTVGQCMGLKEMNGDHREVYDGDYCEIRIDFSPPDADKSRIRFIKAHVYYDNEMLAWCWHEIGTGTHSGMFNEHEFDIMEILSNIHDNPELTSKD